MHPRMRTDSGSMKVDSRRHKHPSFVGGRASKGTTKKQNKSGGPNALCTTQKLSYVLFGIGRVLTCPQSACTRTELASNVCCL